MSSPKKRTEKTRRVVAEPWEECNASMWKNTASPGCKAQPKILWALRSASMSG